jgi:hypothetical protein
MRTTSSDVTTGNNRAEMATFPRIVHERDAILHVDENCDVVRCCVESWARRKNAV